MGLEEEEPARTEGYVITSGVIRRGFAAIETLGISDSERPTSSPVLTSPQP